ncbi:hypothetical protein EW146_g2102 [Bondarzewia mesenterica]|uniref:Uncharacterized protein n=1 Tax=Bondarzewia mesenterica TaxID=1095465 RepID=A0A4S4M1Q0_9AGAM|nr:hypothetical protein EW146_g2102 [Bondarzewia mesenterica]
MATSPIPIYILSDSAELPDDKVNDLVHTFTTTSAVQPVAIITFITTRPTRPLSTPQDLVSYHFETKQPNTPVSPILALDKRSGEDGTVLFAAPALPRDEVELSDDEEEEEAAAAAAADDDIMHCRVVAEWVNALAANMAIGHQSPDLVRIAFGGILTRSYMLIVVAISTSSAPETACFGDSLNHPRLESGWLT